MAQPAVVPREKHRWTEGLAKDSKKRVLVCAVCGMTVGRELGDVLRPTCYERIVKQVMES